MGSDNYGITPRCDMLANSFLVAMKTGLPVTAIYMSRASITQSIKNIALVMEPYRDLAIMKDFPDKKPFLIVAGRCNDYTPEEKNLLHLGIKIDSNTYFNLYRLAFDSLLLLPQKKSKEIVEEFGKFQFQKHETIYKSNPAAKIVQVTYDSQGEGKGYQGKALQVTGRSKSILFDNPLQIAGDSTYSLSFWFSPINVDLFPKTRLAIEWYNVRGERYDDKNIMLGTCIKTIDGPWGLIEYSFQIANPGDRVKITVYNTQIGRKKFYQIDELLIRPDDCDVYYSRDNYVYKNNRWFYLRKENKAITEVPGK
jgi:hypothetical protein